jgi:hypothetical protein
MLLFLSYLSLVLLIVGTVDCGYNQAINSGMFRKNEVDNWGEKAGIRLGKTRELYDWFWGWCVVDGTAVYTNPLSIPLTIPKLYTFFTQVEDKVLGI